MTLSEVIQHHETCSIIYIQYGSETVYCGPDEKLGEKIDNKFFDMEVATISSRIVELDKKYYPALYIYFYY